MNALLKSEEQKSEKSQDSYTMKLESELDIIQTQIEESEKRF